jgi:hypothetical protein
MEVTGIMSEQDDDETRFARTVRRLLATPPRPRVRPAPERPKNLSPLRGRKTPKGTKAKAK